MQNESADYEDVVGAPSVCAGTVDVHTVCPRGGGEHHKVLPIGQDSQLVTNGGDIGTDLDAVVLGDWIEG